MSETPRERWQVRLYADLGRRRATIAELLPADTDALSEPTIVPFSTEADAVAYCARLNAVLADIAFESDWWDNIALVADTAKPDVSESDALKLVAERLRLNFLDYPDAPVEEQEIVARGATDSFFAFACDTKTMSGQIYLVDKKTSTVVLRGYSWKNPPSRQAIFRELSPPLTLVTLEKTLGVKWSPPRRPMLVYLDQSYLGRMLEPAHEQLLRRTRELVDGGTIVAPISMTHWLELFKTHEPLRSRLLELLLALSRGHGLVSMAELAELEWQRHLNRAASTWIRARILTTSATRMFARPRDAELYGIPEMSIEAQLKQLNPTAPSLAIRDVVDDELLRGAERINTDQPSRAEIWMKVREGLATLLSEKDLPTQGEELEQAFPSFAVRIALDFAIRDRVPGGHEPNDLADSYFLMHVLPYFDLVTVDRAMGARIEEARTTTTAIRAQVVRRIDDLLPSLEELAEAEALAGR